jgi:outer membrane protein assembly factor BamB
VRTNLGNVFLALVLGVCLAVVVGTPHAGAATLIGTSVVQAGKDSDAAGTAEAFQATASASGTVAQLVVYLDTNNAATRVVVGIFSDSTGHPGTLLTQATISAPVKGAWNTVTVPAVAITSGQPYWFAILSPSGAGVVQFRDKLGGGRAETSAATTLSALPATWTTGATWPDGPLSIYAITAATSTPILTTAPTSLSFSATVGGANPAIANLSVTNTGAGSLSFTSASNQTWASVTPASGTAPVTEQVSVSITGLAAGTYMGQITITAPGAAGSPAVIPVTLIVSTAAPVLSVSPPSLSFTAAAGGANPAAASFNITNTGGGTLSFTSATNQSWLSASPTSGTAPITEQVSVSTAGLAAGTYTGRITITATGATGSPAVIPITLTVTGSVNTSSDWPMVGQNPSRTSFASNDTTINKANVATLGLKWSANLDGKVMTQPLFLSGVSINGVTHDMVLAGSNQDSLYAFDADTGALLWVIHLSADAGGSWSVPGGLGLRSAPAVDRATERVFVMSDDGKLHTISLTTGTDLVPAVQIIDLPLTNKVRGGLNLFANNLYIATGSDSGDTAPWHGRIYQMDVSGAVPVLGTTFDVVPSITGNNRGGGIWSYGGISVDPATGNVYAATGADYQSRYTPYAVRMLKLTPTLSLVGSYEPQHPATYACEASPCDVDFSATPTVFTPTTCPTMVAAGNKDGRLYIVKTADFATTTSVYQAITVNTADDGLKHGGLGGIPAFWPAGNMLFVTDSGTGVAGVPAGVIGLSISAAPQCQLSIAWTAPLPNLGSAQSSPTVVGDVVLVGEGATGVVHAFDTATGTELWNSGSTVSGGTFAAPSVGKGKVFVGSWTGATPTDFGVLRAFALGAGSGGEGCTGVVAPVLAGTQTLEPALDNNSLGNAEAFQVTGTSCGTANSLNVYLDASSTAATIVVGLYADSAGHPGMLMTQGSTSAPVAGAWNKIVVPPVNVTTGTRYWIAVLGTTSGKLAFRDTSGGCRSEVSASSTLTTLPSTWVGGASYPSCPLSAYVAP